MKILDITAADETAPSYIPALLGGIRPALIWWFAAVILATIAGYPGVIMITPVAWVLAFWIGTSYALHSRALGLRPQLRLAALLGVIFSLILAVLFAAVGFIAIPLEPDEGPQMIRLTLGMAGVGAVVCAAFSIFTAWLARRRTATYSGEHNA